MASRRFTLLALCLCLMCGAATAIIIPACCPEEMAPKYYAGWEQCLVGVPTDATQLGMNGWNEPRTPILEVFDFDGSGEVDAADLEAVKSRADAYRADPDLGYEAIFDADGDCDVDTGDVLRVMMQLGTKSREADRAVAAAFARYEDFGDVRGVDELFALGLFPIPIPLKGHGVHWFTPAGLAVMQGFTLPDFQLLQGANIPDDESPQRAHGVFWPGHAVPVFRDADGVEGVFDFPISPFFDTSSPGVELGVVLDPPCTPLYWGGPDNSCKWQALAPVRFANPSPQISGDTRCETWHTHGGLCMFVNAESGVSEAHQFTSLDECVQMGQERGDSTPPWLGVEVEVELPNGEPFQVTFPPTLWANFWMVHFWLFDPNPLGLYAGWHPTINLEADSEATINEFALSRGRPIEPWFAARPGIADVCCRAVGVASNECCEDADWREDECCTCEPAPSAACPAPVQNCHSGVQE